MNKLLRLLPCTTPARPKADSAHSATEPVIHPSTSVSFASPNCSKHVVGLSNDNSKRGTTATEQAPSIPDTIKASSMRAPSATAARRAPLRRPPRPSLSTNDLMGMISPKLIQAWPTLPTEAPLLTAMSPGSHGQGPSSTELLAPAGDIPDSTAPMFCRPSRSRAADTVTACAAGEESLSSWVLDSTPARGLSKGAWGSSSSAFRRDSNRSLLTTSNSQLTVTVAAAPGGERISRPTRRRGPRRSISLDAAHFSMQKEAAAERYSSTLLLRPLSPGSSPRPSQNQSQGLSSPGLSQSRMGPIHSISGLSSSQRGTPSGPPLSRTASASGTIFPASAAAAATATTPLPFGASALALASVRELEEEAVATGLTNDPDPAAAAAAAKRPPPLNMTIVSSGPVNTNESALSASPSSASLPRVTGSGSSRMRRMGTEGSAGELAVSDSAVQAQASPHQQLPEGAGTDSSGRGSSQGAHTPAHTTPIIASMSRQASNLLQNLFGRSESSRPHQLRSQPVMQGQQLQGQQVSPSSPAPARPFSTRSMSFASPAGSTSAQLPMGGTSSTAAAIGASDGGAVVRGPSSSGGFAHQQAPQLSGAAGSGRQVQHQAAAELTVPEPVPARVPNPELLMQIERVIMQDQRERTTACRGPVA